MILALASLAAMAFILAAQINVASGRRGAEPRCPSCGTRDTRASSHIVLRDYLFSLFACAPFRCRHCAARFYWHVGDGRFDTESL
jgi:hypothetical protein